MALHNAEHSAGRLARTALATLAGLSLWCAAGERGAAGGEAPRKDGAEPRMLRFLALGDSYTIGEGVAAEGRWPVQLAALLRRRGLAVAEPEIVARTGWTVAELAAGIDAAAPRGPYALVTLLIGVNDQYRGGRPEAYRPAFAAMLRRAAALAGGVASHVVVLSIPDWSVTPFAGDSGTDTARIAGEIRGFNQVNRQETRLAGAFYVDVTPSSRRALDDRSLLAGDGLHPAAAMYAEWARLALPAAAAALQ